MWFELLPQPNEQTKPDAGSWIFVSPGVKSDSEIKMERWDRLEYFPENVGNIKSAEQKQEVVRFDSVEVIPDELPHGPPDYVLGFFASKDLVFIQNEMIKHFFLSFF